MGNPRQLKHAGHDGVRAVMRVFGPLLILVGAAMFVAGVMSFVQNFDRGPSDLFGSFAESVRKLSDDGKGTVVAAEPRPPNRFWMCFVGMPIAMVGLGLTRFGFLGAAARYVASETAPVARDTIDYLARGTSDSIREVAAAVRGGHGAGVRCPGCGQDNDADAKFCDACGAALARPCPSCNESNDADAKFCDACGSAL